MYVDVPTNVSAIELMSSPETPKSQILISPRELHSIFDGLMSERDDVMRMFQVMAKHERRCSNIHMALDGMSKRQSRRTAVNDAMHIVEICQPF
jgi:hypothetical protein